MSISPTTLLFETLNFLLLVWLLSKLLYKPLRRAIDARNAELARQQREAEAALAAARALEGEWKQKHAQLSALEEEVRTRALEDAIAERARLLAQAREDAAAERAQARHLLEAERHAAEAWVRTLAIERSTELAGQLLMALAPDAVDAALRDKLMDELERHAERLSPDDGGVPEVEIAGARLPDDALIDRVRGILSAAFGRAPQLTVSEDRELLGGLQLRIGDRVLDASVSGQLEAFRGLAREIADAGAASHD